jgi:hypothetical protein
MNIQENRVTKCSKAPDALHKGHKATAILHLCPPFTFIFLSAVLPQTLIASSVPSKAIPIQFSEILFQRK